MEEIYYDSFDATCDFWQRRTPKTLTAEDARQIGSNLVTFFEILEEWDRKARDSDVTGDSRAEVVR